MSAALHRSVAAPLAAGSELAPGYVVERHLSRGQALDVYDVFSTERGCRCVAKVLRPDCRTHPRRLERLRREGELLLGLAHPHLVRAYEVLEAPQLTVVMEALWGERLDVVIHDGARRLPAADVALLGTQLCSAVGYLHHHGWLHLDLKPDNVVVSLDVARVLDLSLVRRPGPGPRGYGTSGYRSPEQEAGGELTPATDVYGIGAVLFEGATRRPPGPAPPPVRTLRRLPASLADAIDAALHARPADRPVLAELAAACQVESG